MRAGLGLLRLSPDVFWSMTPREFAAAIEGVSGTTSPISAPNRSIMDDLMSRYPDA
jgi:uncharacterized phage protein (TIGR02216 family)